jgi:drug/metabolite transporter (DMT)-like permease
MIITPTGYKKIGVVFIVSGIILIFFPLGIDKCPSYIQCLYAHDPIIIGMIFVVVGAIIAGIGGAKSKKAKEQKLR